MINKLLVRLLDGVSHRQKRYITELDTIRSTVFNIEHCIKLFIFDYIKSIYDHPMRIFILNEIQI